VWRILRTAILLLVLVWAASRTWLDYVASTGWKETLWVGVYPIDADASPATRRYVAELTPRDFGPIESFFAREASRYGLALSSPVHIELYPSSSERPPQFDSEAGPLAVIWWSLKVRWFAARATSVPGRAPPRVRVFVLYHDPSALETMPDSHGMQKGLIGVVHAFAEPAATSSNDIVIAHELLHTLGASDKYDLSTGAPIFPEGYAEPDRSERYPQPRAEIMAGRRALSEREFEMPRDLRAEVIGPVTAAEIRWTHR